EVARRLRPSPRRLAALVLCLTAVAPAAAHHSFAMFDTAKRVTLVGTVTAFEWTTPHVYIELDVPGENGAVKNCSVELGSPSILMQAGWKFSDVKVGDALTAVINPLRNGEAGGLLTQVTLQDGRVLGHGPGRGGAEG